MPYNPHQRAGQGFIIGVVLMLLGALLLGLTLSLARPALGADETSTCVTFDTRFIWGVTASSETKQLPSPLPAGTYEVEIVTFDGYEDRANSDPALQSSERVRVLSVTSDDLADGVAYAEGRKTGIVVLDAPITEVTAYHVGEGGWNSVITDAVCFTLIPDEPEPPTTQPPATTVPPISTVPPPDKLCVDENGNVIHVGPNEECPAPPPPTTTPAPPTTVPPPPPTTTPPAPTRPPAKPPLNG